MKESAITYHINLLGEPCPYPAIKTMEALQKLQKGEILQIISDCPQSIHAIPLDAKNYGYDVLEILQEGVEIHYFIGRNF
ncbi:sulfurtransferase-like selenium metabolism protein YedF [Helicobacter mustelae]|uniref:Putative response regulator n=1 Tax=Helicobacter mustelae (strain ATCC 43772 / CCUG 25715 / CIP 103759 / LMG 18044 / NCTC 12198 / R85-136P) TaxID=679897 RepID=D3UH41_HELM1|nr:sulfurtransferase-like selenium metabolism protein YedF [Helicobacter mustelae]CBG39813.1 putative response regulator [Helicobacter mustelae 12198]SQH71322.1 response regulator [Helicobacter mustelae]STP12448.1 response regulator [Helicobacter mustelae]